MDITNINIHKPKPLMTTPTNSLTLAHWRRTVAEMYAAVRRASAGEREAAWQTFRAARDDLFRSHPQSPLDSAQRVAFETLPYYSYDSAWRVIGTLDRDAPRETLTVNLSSDGEFHYTRVARVYFEVCSMEGALSLFWIEGYGGGLFLPFRDASNRNGSYGGGRYLYDTIKGADLGANADKFVLDFNYAYNPSCAYNPRWMCPLPQPENRLSFAVTAGEQAYPYSKDPMFDLSSAAQATADLHPGESGDAHNSSVAELGA